MQVPPPRTGPLVGLKVLEIGHYIAAPVLHPHPGRPRRRGDQGGAAGRRSVPRLGRGGRWALGVVQRARPQQAVGGAGPEARPRHRAAAGGARRRAGGEPARRRARAAGPRAGGAARGQPAPGDRAHLGLRPGRPVPRQAGVRRDRRGDGRHPPPHRASRRQLRPAAAALRHLDQRRPGGAVCGDRAAVGAVAARRGGHRARARGGREPGGQRVQPDGGHAAGIRHGRPGAAAGGRGDRDRGADQHLSLRRRADGCASPATRT